MTHIVASPKLAKKISLDPEKNARIKSLQRKLVALSFSKGNHSIEYTNTLEVIRQLRKNQFD